MRLLLDENLPRDLATALRLMQFDVTHVRDVWPVRTPDEQIAEYDRERGAVIVTRDSRFHGHELIAQALKTRDVAILTITLPRDYDGFSAIRDVLWVLIEEWDRVPLEAGAHVRCSVRHPAPQRNRRGRPLLTFTVPARRPAAGC